MWKGKEISIVFCALALFIFNSGAVRAQEKFTMKIASPWAGDQVAPNQMLNYIKPRIEQITGGRVQVDLNKGTLGGMRGLFEGVQLGTIQGVYCTASGVLGDFIPEMNVVMIPYIFKNANHARAVMDGYFGEHISKVALGKGMRILGWGTGGARGLYGKGKPIPIRPEDLRGKKIRVMPTPYLVQVYKHYGALPVPMAWPEVYTALQQGVIDGVQAGFAGMASGHNELAQWYVNLEENITIEVFMVSEKWWSKLPDDIKVEIKQVAAEQNRIEGFLDDREQRIASKQWTDSGVKVVEPDREAFEKKAKELYPKFAKMLGSDKWINWIEEVGKSFPLEENESLKKYGKINYVF